MVTVYVPHLICYIGEGKAIWANELRRKEKSMERKEIPFIHTSHEKKEIPLIDAHIHLPAHPSAEEKSGWLSLFAQKDIQMLVSVGSPEEYHQLARWIPGDDRSRIFRSFGIHPWKADQIDLRELEPEGRLHTFLMEADAIGEIGMDQVWCEVPLAVQRKVFEVQLEIAQQRNCPVVLHTKGCEKEIASILDRRPELSSILVHWYSGEEDSLDQMVERGCYFSLGPDIGDNPAVRRVAQKAPLSRILTESDGLAAAEWATGKAVCPEQLSGMLQNTINIAATEKNCFPEEVTEAVSRNFQQFLWGALSSREN